MDGKKPLFSADAAEEYFSTLLTYYRNTGNDIFKRDNEGRHVSDQIYSAEYQKYLGMQIAMREVLEYFSKFELGDTALRQQGVPGKDVGKNEPLTNAQKIRAMTDEELVNFLMRLMGHAQCFAEGIFPYHPCPQEQNCKQCGIDWLQQPAEEDDHA